MQHKEDKEGFTPMPEGGSGGEMFSSEKERSKKNLLQKNTRGPISDSREPSVSDSKEEESPLLGAVVGAVIILGTIVASGAYLYYQSQYGVGAQAPKGEPLPYQQSSSLQKEQTPSLPPPPPPISSVPLPEKLLASPAVTIEQ